MGLDPDDPVEARAVPKELTRASSIALKWDSRAMPNLAVQVRGPSSIPKLNLSAESRSLTSNSRSGIEPRPPWYMGRTIYQVSYIYIFLCFNALFSKFVPKKNL